mmetsp:Transcript_1161/g.1613  ORF Transcript_1161/g.1613 Transcript_1161/m.1613 type:complete len:363 (-) Transcript_1161:252-1340(-)
MRLVLKSSFVVFLVGAFCCLEYIEGFFAVQHQYQLKTQQQRSSTTSFSLKSSATSSNNDESNNDIVTSPSNNNHNAVSTKNRRQVLQGLTAASTSMMMISSSSLMSPSPSFAAEGGGSTSMVDPKEVLMRLRPVPTFCIVDNTGTPYMIIESDNGGGRGYFFTSFSGAMEVLSDAKKGAEEAGYPETWEGATIMTVPLDIAMRLSVTPKKRKTQAGIVLDSVSDVISSAEGIEDALKFTRSQRYSQKGRVPLFVANELTVAQPDGTVKKPAYFRVNDLREEWNAQYPDGGAVPTIQVIDLLETFTDMVKPGGRNENVKDLIFIPVKEVVEVAKELKTKQLAGEGGGKMIYQVNDMLLVGGKK